MEGDTTGMVVVLAMTALLWAPMIIRELRTGRAKKRPKGAEPEPICGCEHHLAFHTPEGVCKEQVPIPDGENKFKVYDCTCQQYVGPIPSISPQILRELAMPPSSVEPYSQEK